MFNLQGSEIIIILLLALVVLGPEKLPEAMRRAGRFYADIKKMSSGFQEEFRSALDEPAREMRETANLLRDSADFTKLQAGEREEKPKSAEMPPNPPDDPPVDPPDDLPEESDAEPPQQDSSVPTPPPPFSGSSTLRPSSPPSPTVPPEPASDADDAPADDIRADDPVSADAGGGDTTDEGAPTGEDSEATAE